MSSNNQTSQSTTTEKQSKTSTQYSTFWIGGRLYGIDVTQVQEVVRTMPLTRIPTSPVHIRGLINLRGQVATAIGLRELFSIADPTSAEFMNVVCRVESALLALQVEEIGDVVEVALDHFEDVPSTVPASTRRFLLGIYKMPKDLLSIIDVSQILHFLNEGSGNKQAA